VTRPLSPVVTGLRLPRVRGLIHLLAGYRLILLDNLC